jgi:hypothetical protein
MFNLSLTCRIRPWSEVRNNNTDNKDLSDTTLDQIGHFDGFRKKNGHFSIFCCYLRADHIFGVTHSFGTQIDPSWQPPLRLLVGRNRPERALDRRRTANLFHFTLRLCWEMISFFPMGKIPSMCSAPHSIHLSVPSKKRLRHRPKLSEHPASI